MRFRLRRHCASRATTSVSRRDNAAVTFSSAWLIDAVMTTSIERRRRAGREKCHDMLLDEKPPVHFISEAAKAGRVAILPLLEFSGDVDVAIAARLRHRAAGFAIPRERRACRDSPALLSAHFPRATRRCRCLIRHTA